MGDLIEGNMLYDYDDFEWFRHPVKKNWGKKTVQMLLYRPDADESTKNMRVLGRNVSEQGNRRMKERGDPIRKRQTRFTRG